MELFFPFVDYWWFYAGFAGFVLVLLAIDLGIVHRQAHVAFRESLGWSAVWVALALAFNYGFYLYASSKFGPDAGRQFGLEFLAGYIVEKSLAVDNIFVFVLVFAYFGIPPIFQHRVLFYGPIRVAAGLAVGPGSEPEGSLLRHPVGRVTDRGAIGCRASARPLSASRRASSPQPAASPARPSPTARAHAPVPGCGLQSHLRRATRTARPCRPRGTRQRPSRGPAPLAADARGR